MTPYEAIAIASRKARELNMPWGPDATATPLWRVWPFPRVWRVVCRVPKEFSQTTLLVSERTRTAIPKQVLVRREFGPSSKNKP